MADATLEELFTDYNAKFTATAAEIEAWNELEPVEVAGRLRSGMLGVGGAENTVVTKIGLWGQDLTDFLEACETSDDCDPADYDAWNGWGVGVQWAGTALAAIDGVVFTESLQSVQVAWDDENVVEFGVVDEVDEEAPVAEGNDLEAAADAFEGWGAANQAGDDEEQFAFYFFEDGAEFYFEVEDTASIWATQGAVAEAAGNVETAEFAFVGAVTLTAATSVIVASLLF